MTRIGRALAIGLVALAASARADEPVRAGPQGPERGPYREQLWRVPVPEADGRGERFIEVMIYRPPGSMRRPLVILSHGTARPGRPHWYVNAYWAERPAAFLVREGYAVAVPIRRGYGHSGGQPRRHIGRGCQADSTEAAAREDAAQILAVLAQMRRQSFVDGDRVVLAGQSAGGLASLAAAALRPQGVRGVVSFAGGLRWLGPDAGCSEARLLAAVARFGATTQAPSLWLYAENDRTFPPDLAARMLAAHVGAGGRARLVGLPSFGQDGHGFVRLRASEMSWQPAVREFLAGLALGARPEPSVPPLGDVEPREERLGGPGAPPQSARPGLEPAPGDAD
jgi:dienelactone hydrolase